MADTAEVKLLTEAEPEDEYNLNDQGCSWAVMLWLAALAVSTVTKPDACCSGLTAISTDTMQGTLLAESAVKFGPSSSAAVGSCSTVVKPEEDLQARLSGETSGCMSTTGCTQDVGETCCNALAPATTAGGWSEMAEVGNTAAAAVDMMVVACGGVVDRKGDCKAALAVALRLGSGWSKGLWVKTRWLWDKVKVEPAMLNISNVCVKLRTWKHIGRVLSVAYEGRAGQGRAGQGRAGEGVQAASIPVVKSSR